jgi:hypothetical protein
MQHLQCLFPTETAALWDNIVFAATTLPVKMGDRKVRVCVAMKASVRLLSGRAVCVSRWRGLAPTSSADFPVPRNNNISYSSPICWAYSSSSSRSRKGVLTPSRSR